MEQLLEFVSHTNDSWDGAGGCLVQGMQHRPLVVLLASEWTLYRLRPYVLLLLLGLLLPISVCVGVSVVCAWCLRCDLLIDASRIYGKSLNCVERLNELVAVLTTDDCAASHSSSIPSLSPFSSFT